MSNHLRISFSLLFIVLLSCKPGYRIESTQPTEYVFSDTSITPADSAIIGFITPYKEKMEGEMNSVIAESVYPMERGLPEGRLGNFVADACMSEGAKLYYPSDNKTIDFTFLNNGGLRRPLPSGNITRGDVYELMPFENELVVLTLDGVRVKKIFNFIASKGGAPVSGVRFTIKNKEAGGILINGLPLDTAKTYKALTSDYLANGGDSFGMLIDAKRESTGLKVRDAIMQYMILMNKQGKKIEVNTDGRIKNE
jgi:2',3'-cyclic-nucleotide 2'-phosphodiesterase (5'-nucleotidase family)